MRDSDVLVQVGDIDPDITAGRPRHGDVIDVRPSGWVWGGKEMEGRRLVTLSGEPEQWVHLLASPQEEGAVSMFRKFYLDDDNVVRERVIVPLVLH